MNQADYYQILQVDQNATAAQIKESYRHLAFKYHPDRNKENPAAVEKMKKINEAYAVLSNPAKKSDYDSLRGRFGDSAYTHFRKNYSEQDIFSGSDINRIFEEMAKTFGLRGSNEVFREFYGRGFQQFVFKRPGFDSRGFLFRGPSQTDNRQSLQSPLTGNLGHVFRFLLKKITGVQLPEDGADIQENLHLDAKQAEQGGPYAYYLRRRSKKLVVKIPPGIRGGQQIRLTGMGEPGKAGGKPGDLLLKVHIRKPLVASIKALFSRHKANS